MPSETTSSSTFLAHTHCYFFKSVNRLVLILINIFARIKSKKRMLKKLNEQLKRKNNVIRTERSVEKKNQYP
jgi:hypothetical protein